MTTPIPGQLSMFDLPPATPVPVPKRPRQDTGRPRWTKYAAKNRQPCDDCKLAQAQGVLTSAATLASVARTQGGRRLLLCTGHAAKWRDRDELSKLDEAGS